MPEFKFFPETHVAFVSEVGPYEKSLDRGFRRLFAWLNEQGVRPIGPSLGIYHDDPDRVAAENLRCDLCAPVGPEVEGTGQIRTKEIGGWKVATTTFEGEENSPPAYHELYDWLRAQGYHEVDAPVVKYLSQLGERLKVEIAVPVVEQKHLPGKQKVKASNRRDAATPAKKKNGTSRSTKATTKKPARKSK